MRQLTSCAARACLDGCNVAQHASRKTEPHLAQWRRARTSALFLHTQAMVNTRLLCEPGER
jgi:hypothetical protein